jgi:hypothetical protein
VTTAGRRTLRPRWPRWVAALASAASVPAVLMLGAMLVFAVPAQGQGNGQMPPLPPPSPAGGAPPIDWEPNPGPPSRVINLRAITSDRRVMLHWNASEPSDFSHYNVYRRTLGRAWSDVPIGTATAAPFDDTVRRLRGLYTDTDVSPRTTYVYRVTSVDQDGNESVRSREEPIARPLRLRFSNPKLDRARRGDSCRDPYLVGYNARTRKVQGDTDKIRLRISRRSGIARWERRRSSVVLCEAAGRWWSRWEEDGRPQEWIDPNPRGGLWENFSVRPGTGVDFLYVTARRVRGRTGSSCRNPWVAWYDYGLQGTVGDHDKVRVRRRSDGKVDGWRATNWKWEIQPGLKLCEASEIAWNGSRWTQHRGTSHRVVHRYTSSRRMYVAVARR